MTAEEKYYGYKLRTICPHCLGLGQEPSVSITFPPKTCEYCGGWGILWQVPTEEVRKCVNK